MSYLIGNPWKGKPEGLVPTTPPIEAFNLPQPQSHGGVNGSYDNESCLSSLHMTSASQQGIRDSDDVNRNYEKQYSNLQTNMRRYLNTSFRRCSECFRTDISESDLDLNQFSKLSRQWTEFTYEYRWYIIACWIAFIWPLGAFCYPRFTKSTSSEFSPVPGSLSFQADQIFKDAFDVPLTIRLPAIMLLEQISSNISTSYFDNNYYDSISNRFSPWPNFDFSEPTFENQLLLEDRCNSTTTTSLIDGHSELYNSTRYFVFSFKEHLEELIYSYGPNPKVNGMSSTIYEHESTRAKIEQDGEVDEVMGYITSDVKLSTYIKVNSYYGAEQQQLYSLARRQFASSSGNLTYVKIDYATPTVKNMREFLQEMTTYAEDHVPRGVKVSFTGIHFFQDDILAGAKADVKRMDTIVLPLALIILAIVLGNLPVMAIPLFTIISATLLSSIIMYPVAMLIQVTQFTQSLMSSLIISMSIDYSLFLLARCIEDLAQPRLDLCPTEFELLKRKAINTMLEYSGHTIIASGVTLCCCFLGLLFLPLAMLKSVGVGSSVAILSSLLVNLTLVPSILHTSIGTHMLSPNECLKTLSCCLTFKQPRQRINRTETDNSLDEVLLRCREQEEENEMEYAELLSASSFAGIGGNTLSLSLNHDNIDIVHMKKSVWYRWAEILVHPLKGGCIVVILLTLAMPVALYFPKCGSSISFEPMLPAKSLSKQAFDHLGAEFGAGSLFPFRIIFDGRDSHKHTDTAESFEIIQSVVRELSGASFPATLNITSFTSIATIGGRYVPHWFYEASVICGTHCYFETMRTVAAIAKSLNAPHNMTTYANVILTLDPNSNEGTQWLLNAREKIQLMASSGDLGNLSIYIEGGSGVEYDAVKAVYDHVPRMIGITLSVVFALMAVFFRSFLVPIRSVVTISFTQAFVFGLAVLVYQHGALDFMKLRCVSNAGEISWLPPVISFCVMVGLGLDYDVFLSSRVLEYRLKGFGEKSSIVIGLYKTGRIITAAGVIMAVAFGGLFGSTSLILNETAFLLTTAVLMDTFVTRTIVLPILMNLTGSLNWWPRKLPPVRFDIITE